MKQLLINNRVIDIDHPYVIAEIGSNHNGSIDLCKKMFIKAKECGADAVKLQKRFNREMFMKSILNSPYQSEYAKETGTYGEHRENLDSFGLKEYAELQRLASDLDIDFGCTPFDIHAVDFLETFDMAFYKIASCDLTNFPLMRQIIQTGKPIILSTGGGTWADINRAYEFLTANAASFAILHCVSIYPNSDQDLNLSTIEALDKSYDCLVGWSSHHPGLLCNFFAYGEGARIIEVHFTLNRAWAEINKDHAFSLEPQALRQLCFDLKRIPVMKGLPDKIISEKERNGFIYKFGKAIHPLRTINKGEVLTPANIGIKAPASGIRPEHLDNVVGKIAICEISTADSLEEDMLGTSTDEL